MKILIIARYIIFTEAGHQFKLDAGQHAAHRTSAIFFPGHFVFDSIQTAWTICKIRPEVSTKLSIFTYYYSVVKITKVTHVDFCAETCKLYVFTAKKLK